MMLWTTVCDLTFKKYQKNQALDSTDFNNNAGIKGNIATNPKYVSFKDPNGQLVVMVKDDSLQRFTGLKVEALIYPTSKTRRLNIVEGWMSFAFFIEANRSLVATVYDGKNWIGVNSGKIKVPLNEWSSVAFEYDGISLGKLTINNTHAGTSLTMPMGMYQPKQNITIGHWPSGDGRYTFIGDIGHTRISKRDYEDFWRAAVITLFCNRKLSPAQADAMEEFNVIAKSLDKRTKESIKKCAKEVSQKLIELVRVLRDGNMRNIVLHRQFANLLRQAWCCRLDELKAKQVLLDFLHDQAGKKNTRQYKEFKEIVEEFLKLRYMCERHGMPYDRLRELLFIAVPELSHVNIELDQIATTI